MFSNENILKTAAGMLVFRSDDIVFGAASSGLTALFLCENGSRSSNEKKLTHFHTLTVAIHTERKIRRLSISTACLTLPQEGPSVTASLASQSRVSKPKCTVTSRQIQVSKLIFLLWSATCTASARLEMLRPAPQLPAKPHSAAPRTPRHWCVSLIRRNVILCLN